MDRPTLSLPQEHERRLRAADDVKIMQKVNGARRSAFVEKYPQQLEHCLRLVMERLQLGLDKREGQLPGDADSWHLTAAELESLGSLAFSLHQMRQTCNE